MDRYNSKIAGLVGKLNGHDKWAVTISATCTLYSCEYLDITPRWYAHEEMHKQQIIKEGWFKFMVKYFWYNITVGYKSNPYEQN